MRYFLSQIIDNDICSVTNLEHYKTRKSVAIGHPTLLGCRRKHDGLEMSLDENKERAQKFDGEIFYKMLLRIQS